MNYTCLARDSTHNELQPVLEIVKKSIQYSTKAERYKYSRSVGTKSAYLLTTRGDAKDRKKRGIYFFLII